MEVSSGCNFSPKLTATRLKFLSIFDTFVMTSFLSSFSFPPSRHLMVLQFFYLSFDLQTMFHWYQHLFPIVPPGHSVPLINFILFFPFTHIFPPIYCCQANLPFLSLFSDPSSSFHIRSCPAISFSLNPLFLFFFSKYVPPLTGFTSNQINPSFFSPLTPRPSILPSQINLSFSSLPRQCQENARPLSEMENWALYVYMHLK